MVSDTISNSLRVLKTYRQVNQSRISYSESLFIRKVRLQIIFTGAGLADRPAARPASPAQAAKRIIREEGWLALFGRGLGTRILANGLQGLLFSVLWKLFQDLWEKKVNHA